MGVLSPDLHMHSVGGEAARNDADIDAISFQVGALLNVQLKV